MSCLYVSALMQENFAKFVQQKTFFFTFLQFEDC